jgi:3-oxoacyl-(acyl-carrier-protein) synthase
LSAAFAAVPEALVEEHPDLPAELKRDKDGWMAGIALAAAMRSAALDKSALQPPRTGLVLGCGLAGQVGMIQFANEVREQSPRFVSPIHFPQTVGNFVAGALARGFNITGPSLTLAADASSGLDAIIEAARLVADGRSDVVFAGGVEQLSETLVSGLESGETAYAEGACMLAIENAERAMSRGARPLATVAAWRHESDRTGLVRQTDATICSTAGICLAGAIAIEYLVGRCLGVSGAAAIAGLLAAAEGAAVPIADAAEKPDIRVTTVPPASRGIVVSAADSTHLTVVELELQG